MKTATVLALVTTIVGSTGFLIKIPIAPTQPSLRPSVGWVHIQKLILPLFEYVGEDSTNPIIVRLAEEFTFDSSNGIYRKPEVITNLQNLKTKGLLPKNETFTNYNAKHLYELQIIYEVLCYAKDFDTFYKAAAWARQNLNSGVFINAIYLAILTRKDTEKLSIPAPYELLPNYFFQSDVIYKASALLSGEEVDLSDSVRIEGNSYVLDTNYTAAYMDNDEESKLAYFNEDVGLNSYYFMQKLKRSPWFNTTPEQSISYGEYLYHMMKQLSARYNLERYANGLPEVESINWDQFIAVPYDPKLIYSNGKYFGHRSTSVQLTEDENIQLLRTIESNMATVVSHMRDTGYNKSQILNHVMEILVTGERSFETLLRLAVGKDNESTQSEPSVLEHYMTSVRDPMFWKLNKKVVNLVDNALKILPGYTRSELYFPGIEVLNVDVKKLSTSFDYFQFDITEALKSSSTNTAFQVKLNQPRLNHKPFALKLNISSITTQKGLIKIYLGPKVAPGELVSKKDRFMLLDNFEYNFKVGINVLSRSSEEMKYLSADFTSLKALCKNVEDAEFGLDALPLKDVESFLGFPGRLILPKGTPEGLPLQVFVFVAPFIKPTFGGMLPITNIDFNSEILSPGYPLDLNIPDDLLFDLPNALIKDVIITHKGDKVSNYGGGEASKIWSKGSYDPSSRPDYSAKRKEPFDYQVKKSQYEKKNEYPTEIPVITDKAEVINVQPDVYKNKAVEKVEHNTIKYEEDVIKNLFQNNAEVNEDVQGDMQSLLTSTQYTKTPSVYDYIVNKDDFYDNYYDTVEKVYE